MDPITAGVLAATLVPLASGAAGEAGKQAWGSLAGYVRSRFGRGSAADEAAQALTEHPGEAVHGEVLGRLLERDAAADEQAAAYVRAWLAEAAPLAGQPAPQVEEAPVTNTVSGNVRGNVVQGRTFNGDISFGA